jgi:cytochrome c oxidase subunit II
LTGQFFRPLGRVAGAGLALAPAMALANDAGHPIPGQIGFQESVTPIMDSIIAFHNGVLLWTISAIVLLVLVLLVIVVVRFNKKANPVPSSTTHNTLIEVAWTVLPVLVLMLIAIPSFGVLTDQLTIPDGVRKYLGANIFSWGEVDVPAPGLTIKVTGQQWYWNYDYVDNGDASYDSNILTEEVRLAEPNPQPRLLGVDNMMVVPVNTTVRLQVTADPTGVIHSFAVPSFGIKVDAVPGRLNETWFNARKEGVYYGQCSELCGKDHAFMPIAVRVVSQDAYKAWVAALGESGVGDANLTLASN